METGILPGLEVTDPARISTDNVMLRINSPYEADGCSTGSPHCLLLIVLAVLVELLEEIRILGDTFIGLAIVVREIELESEVELGLMVVLMVGSVLELTPGLVWLSVKDMGVIVL